MSETLPHSWWLWPIHSGQQFLHVEQTLRAGPLLESSHFFLPPLTELLHVFFFFWFDLRFTLGHWLYIQMMEASGFKKKANDKITKNLHSSVYSQSMVWSSKIIILTPHTEGQVKTNLQPNFKVNCLWNSLLLLHPHLEMWSYISVSLTL